MDDGSEDEFGPGEVSLLPPGHDAWVVGTEPIVVIDISGMANYAKPAKEVSQAGRYLGGQCEALPSVVYQVERTTVTGRSLAALTASRACAWPIGAGEGSRLRR